jgi:hypothetical protein
MIHPDIMHRDRSQRDLQTWLSNFDTLEAKMKGLAGLKSEPEHQIAITLALALERFTSSGRMVFSLGKKLCAALSGIKLKVVRDELRLPFGSFFIDVSEAHPDIWIWGGDRTRWHRLGGAYLYVLPAGLVSGEAGKPYKEESLGIIFWGKSNSNSIDASDDAVYHFIMPLSKIKSPDVGEYIKDRFSTDNFWHAVQDPLRSSDLSLDNKRSEEILKAFRLILNTVLYVTSDEPDIGLDSRTARRQVLEAKLFRAGPAKRPKVKRQLDKTTVCYIQRLAPGLEKSEEPTQSSSGVALHRVRAHFNRYWVGPSHEKYAKAKLKHPDQDKKLIKVFVSEYERGQDLAGRVTGRTYKLE